LERKSAPELVDFALMVLLVFLSVEDDNMSLQWHHIGNSEEGVVADLEVSLTEESAVADPKVLLALVIHAYHHYLCCLKHEWEGTHSTYPPPLPPSPETRVRGFAPLSCL